MSKLYQDRNYIVTRHDCEVCFLQIIKPGRNPFRLMFLQRGQLQEHANIQYPHDFLGVHGMLELMRRTYLSVPKKYRQLEPDFIYGKMNKTKYIHLKNKIKEEQVGSSIQEILFAKYNEFKIDTVYHFFLQFCSRMVKGEPRIHNGEHTSSHYLTTPDVFVDWMYDCMFPGRRNPFDRHWRTVNVCGIARTIFDNEAFDRMPILADALEDAGCNDTLVLSHLRQFTNFTRANWILSRILKKTRYR